MDKATRFGNTADRADRDPASGPGDRLLGVSEVMARYGLRDRRTARGVMDAAGAFVVARRLLVSEADLAAYEDTLRAERRHRRPAVDAPRGGHTGRRALPNRPGALAPGWWREDSS